MNILALLIAIVALVLSAVAFSRTGGIGMIHQQAEEARRLAANALGRVEDVVRPHDQSGEVPATPEGTAATPEGTAETTAAPGQRSDPTLASR